MAEKRTDEPKGRLGNQGYQEGNEGYDENSQDKGPEQQARRHGHQQTKQTDDQGKPPASK